MLNECTLLAAQHAYPPPPRPGKCIASHPNTYALEKWCSLQHPIPEGLLPSGIQQREIEFPTPAGSQSLSHATSGTSNDALSLLMIVSLPLPPPPPRATLPSLNSTQRWPTHGVADLPDVLVLTSSFDSWTSSLTR